MKDLFKTNEFRIASLIGLLFPGAVALELFLEYREGHRRAVPALLWLCAPGANIVCGTVMAARHPAVVQPGVVYGTYILPAMVIWFALLTFTAAGAGRRFRTGLLICLLAAVSLQIGTEAAGNKFQGGGDALSGYASGQTVFKEALRNPGFDEKRYCLPHRMELFLEFFRTKFPENR